MVLTSLVGDADLYISDATNERPTFMFEVLLHRILFIQLFKVMGFSGMKNH